VNPGGSVKDRVARNIIVEAEREGKLRPGVSKLVEATAGRHPPHFPPPARALHFLLRC
jgi:cysteine synthase